MRKNITRALSMVLVVCMVLAFAPAALAAEPSLTATASTVKFYSGSSTYEVYVVAGNLSGSTVTLEASDNSASFSDGTNTGTGSFAVNMSGNLNSTADVKSVSMTSNAVIYTINLMAVAQYVVTTPTGGTITIDDKGPGSTIGTSTGSCVGALGETVFTLTPTTGYSVKSLTINSITYDINSLTTVSGNTYSYTLTNAQSRVYNVSAVFEADVTVPVITVTGPTSTSVVSGSSKTLSVSASATQSGVLSYQWYSATDSTGASGTLISGATSASYPTSTSLSAGTYYYYCVVTATNSAGTAAKTTSTATVTVTSSTTPVITVTSTTPANATVTYPSSTTLSVTASATQSATLTYTWYRSTTNSTTSGTQTQVQSGSSSTYTVPTYTTAGTYYYYCVVSATGASSVTSRVSTVTINSSSTYFTTAPYNLKATAGSKQVKLTWTKSTPTPSYYRVYYGTSTSNMSSYTTTSNTSCTVTGLTNSQKYYFYVEAYTSGYTSASTSTVNATPSSSASTNDDLWVSTSSNSSSDSISTYKFTTKSEGYSSISATTFYIHNDSGSKIYGVDVALSGTNKSDFTLSVSSTSDSISDGSYTTFTIKPDTGLSDGTYKATVKVTSDDTSSYSFTITFIVGDGSDDEFYFSTTKSGSGVSKYSLDSLKAGYSSAPSTTFYVQNETGSSLKKVTLALSGTDKSSFTLSETSLGTISDDSYTTFTVTPKTGLAAGSYTAKITATASDDSTATLTLNLTVTAATTTPTTPVTPSYVFPFTDVTTTTGSWYYNDVLKAHQQGLIDGYTSTLFKPDENLSVAQAIKLAACVHQRYYNGSVTLTNGYPNWYDTYVTYAKNNGIISGDYLDYNAKITREEFVNIFYNALPANDYTIINTLSDTYIPDVQPGATYYSKIFRFYQAGILIGNGNATFSPKNNIKRSEVAAILTRLYDSSERISS